jgi:hypothetical protein
MPPAYDKQIGSPRPPETSLRRAAADRRHVVLACAVAAVNPAYALVLVCAYDPASEEHGGT